MARLSQLLSQELEQTSRERKRLNELVATKLNFDAGKSDFSFNFSFKYNQYMPNIFHETTILLSIEGPKPSVFIINMAVSSITLVELPKGNLEILRKTARVTFN